VWKIRGTKNIGEAPREGGGSISLLVDHWDGRKHSCGRRPSNGELGLDLPKSIVYCMLKKEGQLTTRRGTKQGVLNQR